MKKYPLLILLLFGSIINSSAENRFNRYEFNIGYGWIAPYGFQHINEGGDAMYATGAYTLSSRYFYNDKITFGLCIKVQNEEGNWGNMFSDPPIYNAPVWMGTYKRLTYTIAPELTFTYANSPKGYQRIYGTIAAGINYDNEIDTYGNDYYAYSYHNGKTSLGNNMEIANNKLAFNMYLSPMGMRFGRTFGGFFEVGYGFKGLINFGLNYKIK